SWSHYPFFLYLEKTIYYFHVICERPLFLLKYNLLSANSFSASAVVHSFSAATPKLQLHRKPPTSKSVSPFNILIKSHNSPEYFMQQYTIV
ncbi:hypothetical protein ACUOBA_38870, partial [Escherichia coli]